MFVTIKMTWLFDQGTSHLNIFTELDVQPPLTACQKLSFSEGTQTASIYAATNPVQNPNGS
jgi:hypothetical protein